jgi:hypothetical protein
MNVGQPSVYLPFSQGAEFCIKSASYFFQLVSVALIKPWKEGLPVKALKSLKGMKNKTVCILAYTLISCCLL